MTPHLELQKAMIAALRGDPVLASFVGDRIYDRAPQRVEFPYVAIGEMQILADDAECVNGFEIFVDVHVWSRAYGRVECRGILSAVYDIIHEAEFSFTSGAFVEVRMRDLKDFVEPDGETSHGVATFRVLIDQA